MPGRLCRGLTGPGGGADESGLLVSLPTLATTRPVRPPHLQVQLSLYTGVQVQSGIRQPLLLDLRRTVVLRRAIT